ncbi:rhomboid-like protein [Anaeramoeba flamelloides]|uniref:Rhomboid-like protein n=1 Tax=Anaeramoeba flamelloides TaxID=1746091 RepID=A0AAV7ZN09_9EUKA|nr:rhomboid-like protein [Anaeramoeba flamelloides]
MFRRNMRNVNTSFSTIPFVSRMIMILCIVLALLGGFTKLPIQQLCMSPYYIFENWFNFYRIFISPFLHLGFFHILFNMTTFRWMGTSLEKLIGSVNMFILTFLFIILSGILNLGISYASLNLFNYSRFYTSCGVGFSGVIFGMIVIESRLSHQRYRSIWGLFNVPNSVYPIALLIFLQLIMNRVSFIGHLCGLLVGYLYVYGKLNFLFLSQNYVQKIEQLIPKISESQGFVKGGVDVLFEEQDILPERIQQTTNQLTLSVQNFVAENILRNGQNAQEGQQAQQVQQVQQNNNEQEDEDTPQEKSGVEEGLIPALENEDFLNLDNISLSGTEQDNTPPDNNLPSQDDLENEKDSKN